MLSVRPVYIKNKNYTNNYNDNHVYCQCTLQLCSVYVIAAILFACNCFYCSSAGEKKKLDSRGHELPFIYF